MKYIKLFDNHSNSLSNEVTSNIIKDIEDILIEVRDESNLGLVFNNQFQFNKKQVVLYITNNKSRPKGFNMKDILDETLQIISYMESNGFPLISIKCYIDKFDAYSSVDPYKRYNWYNCILIDKNIKGVKSKEYGDYYFDIEDMKSFGLIFSL